MPTAVVVDTLNDIVGADVNGQRTLRWAIGQINASNDTVNSIGFTPNMSGIITVATDLPTITNNVNINGNTAGGGTDISIRRSSAGVIPEFSVLVVEGSVEVDLANLELRNGLSDYGGGLYVAEDATVNLYNVVVEANTAYIFGGGIYNAGTLTVENSSIVYNHVDMGGCGGGIYNAGTLYLQFDSLISSNIVEEIGSGGGIYNEGGASATVSNSTISWNSAVSGAGIYNDEDAALWLSWGAVITHNSASGAGGGVYNVGELSSFYSTFSYNTASLYGGGGVYCAAGSTSTSIGDSYSSNQANASLGTGYGGGFYVEGNAGLSMLGCTVAGNQADDAATVGGAYDANSNFVYFFCIFTDSVGQITP